MTIGESMKEARLKAGLTQKQLAERAGTRQSDISCIERNLCNPTLSTTINLADSLGITIDEYISHSAKPENIPPVEKVRAKPVFTGSEPFRERVRDLLFEYKIPINQFAYDTGIDRTGFFYKEPRKHGRHVYMAIAYYFGIGVEELVYGTDAESDWYGDCGI